MMKKLLASLLFAVPALSMSLYGATLESPKGASHHHHHHHHDCSSSSEEECCERAVDPRFGFFYLNEDQFLDDGQYVNWNANNGTHTDGVNVSTIDSTDIVLAERGLYLVTWVLTVATDPTIPLNGGTQFQLVLNDFNVPGGNYATTVPQYTSAVELPTQLYGQAIITVVNSNSLLSLRNDSNKSVELVSDLLSEVAEEETSQFNVSASIVIQKLSDFCVR